MVCFRCPECAAETEVSAKHGDEVVSVYCLRHTGGADFHTRPVYMTRLPVTTEAEPRRERVLVTSQHRRA